MDGRLSVLPLAKPPVDNTVHGFVRDTGGGSSAGRRSAHFLGDQGFQLCLLFSRKPATTLTRSSPPFPQLFQALLLDSAKEPIRPLLLDNQQRAALGILKLAREGIESFTRCFTKSLLAAGNGAVVCTSQPGFSGMIAMVVMCVSTSTLSERKTRGKWK
jgi:hypothetical protein